MRVGWSELPMLGVGLGYRQEIAEEIERHAGEIDFVEVITDHYIGHPRRIGSLRRLCGTFPIIPHGLEMSVGSDDPLDAEYLDGVAEVADAVDAPWVSDHLCFTQDGGVAVNNLTPVLRTPEKAAQIAAKCRTIGARLGRPFLLENITYYFDMPGGLSEIEFITEILERCEAYLLLDLTNLYLNSVNHGFDPVAFLERLPAERVVQLHLAGSGPEADLDGITMDRHNAAVPQEVLDLLEHLLRAHAPRGVLIERDDDFPDDFDEVLADVRRARAVLAAGDRR